MNTLDINTIDGQPIIGRRYWVPCVRFRQMLWPVIGPSHSDADLGTPEEHLHCDGRFLSERQIQVNLDAVLAAASSLPDLWLPKFTTVDGHGRLFKGSAASAALQLKNMRAGF